MVLGDDDKGQTRSEWWLSKLYPLIQSSGGNTFYGDITTATSTTQFKVDSLASLGTDLFNDAYYCQIIQADAAAPEGEIQKISAYDTSDGDITVGAAFTVAPEVGDYVLILHESLAKLLLNEDNNYSTTGALDFTTEKTVFEIADDTRYEIVNPWIDITPFTNAATITFQFYRSVAVAGGTYRKAGDSITKVVGTDNPVVEFADIAHYGYTKITAVSDNAGDSSVDVPFGYIKKLLE